MEYGAQGNNRRYVVTNLTGDPQTLYDGVYCQRGEAENRIKEAQVGLFATRTSCQQFQSNQLRVLLAAMGYVLIERLRALALQGTALTTAQVDTLRIKLLKVAAVITRNTQRIRLSLASNWPSAVVDDNYLGRGQSRRKICNPPRPDRWREICGLNRPEFNSIKQAVACSASRPNHLNLSSASGAIG